MSFYFYGRIYGKTKKEEDSYIINSKKKRGKLGGVLRFLSNYLVFVILHISRCPVIVAVIPVSDYFAINNLI